MGYIRWKFIEQERVEYVSVIDGFIRESENYKKVTGLENIIILEITDFDRIDLIEDNTYLYEGTQRHLRIVGHDNVVNFVRVQNFDDSVMETWRRIKNTIIPKPIQEPIEEDKTIEEIEEIVTKPIPKPIPKPKTKPKSNNKRNKNKKK